MLDVTGEFTRLEQHNGILFSRLGGHPSIAVVADLDGLALWQDREALGLNGIICDYPSEHGELEQAAQNLISHAAAVNDFNPLDHANMMSPSALRMQTTIFARAWQSADEPSDLGPVPYKIPAQIHRMTPDVQGIFAVLVDAYVNTARAESGAGEMITVHARVNSDYPMRPHRHLAEDEAGRIARRGGDFLALALSGDGCVVYGDETFADKVKLRTGQIGLFDETVWHSAAPYDELWEESPRANLIIG